MKGVINLSIEVDFDKIICDDSMEALKLYTGAVDKEGVAVFYLEKLANKITSIGEFNLPHVEHKIYGDVDLGNDDEQVQVSEGYTMTDLVKEVESEQPYDAPQEDIQLDDEQVSKQDDFIGQIVSHMEDVSIEKGLPKEIKISAEIFDSLCINEKGDALSRIAGLPVLRDTDLEAIIEVVYEPYGGGELESYYVQTLGKLI